LRLTVKDSESLRRFELAALTASLPMTYGRRPPSGARAGAQILAVR
jgi:hypothetical protein